MLGGRFVARSAATLDLEDRGMMFADGVYEVVRYYGGQALAIGLHHQRMREGLAAIEIEPPECFDRFPALSDELAARNGLGEAKVYWQVTRGVAPRDHDGAAATTPTAMMIAYPERAIDPAGEAPSGAAILVPDERWLRCSIKTTMLLPNVLAKRRARRAGAAEAILHRGETVTEGSSTNVFMVRDGELRTHPADTSILNGITRRIVIDLARGEGIFARECAFSIEELQKADEAFITGTTSHITAITHIDGRPIAHGSPGAVTRRLHRVLMHHIQSHCLGVAAK